MKRITLVCVFSGILAGLLSMALFYFVFPTAWLFFLIPAIMGFCVEKFGNAHELHLEDEEECKKVSRHVGLLCGGLCLTFVILAISPVMLINPIAVFTSVPFDLACGLSVWWGYRRGVKAVMDSYFASIVEAE